MELKQETLEKLREKSKKSLFFFARAILGFRDLDVEIHKPACEAVQEYKKNRRVTVEFPRTWFKSSLFSIAYPIWRVINNSNVRVLIAQNTYDNACKKLRAIDRIFKKNALFRALFYEILPDRSCRWTNECLEVKRTAAHPEGTIEAAGIGTATVGRHYDLIIEDDTIAPKKDDMTGVLQQPTQMDIEKAIGWHKLCYPMLIHPTESQVLVVGTRWADGDLLGYVYDNFPDFINMRKVACEKDGEPATLEEGGSPTWSRFNEDVLKDLAKNEGPYMFACLYLGTPTAAINQVFKREWIKYYDKHPRRCYACTSVDLAAAEQETSSDPDYNVILTTAIHPISGRIFVLGYDRGRMTPGEVIGKIFDHHSIYSPIKVIIEAISYQRVLASWVRKRQKATGRLFEVEEITSYRGKGSKEMRIRGLQPYFAAELIFLKAWMNELEQELLAFPNPRGTHDDIIDTLSMQKDFWSEMMEMASKDEPEEGYDAFSGKVIIGELKDRANSLLRYPYDMGNMDDGFLQERIGSVVMREDLRRRAEDARRESLLV